MSTKGTGYGLTKPCGKCPFRTDVPAYLTRERAEEIIDGLVRGEFLCHQTLDYDDLTEDGEARETDHTHHCAGALIMLEHAERPSQMMRICERIGLYDRTKLRMDSPVFTDPDDFIEAQPR